MFLGQWLNQSFNALVNFTNRSGDKPLPNSVILSAYFAATSLATAASIGLFCLHCYDISEFRCFQYSRYSKFL